MPFDYTLSDEHNQKIHVVFPIPRDTLMPETPKYVEEFLTHRSGA